MNGIHDMGGMTCFGPVQREADEPVFHADWERHAFALANAVLPFIGPVDRLRHAIERMHPVDYLTTSYYEHWLAGIGTLLTEFGYLTDEEIESGRVAHVKEPPHPPPTAAMIEALVCGGAPATRDEGRLEPVLKVGDQVRARNFDSRGHTRLPRYVRGKIGVIAAHHGSHVFPDTMAHDLGENAQPLYTVRFEARELWGDNVERRDCVYIDLWEDYLEKIAEG